MNRRDALKGAAAFLSATGMKGMPGLPDPALLSSDPERYWSRIRAEQFTLPEWRVFMNNGSLGVPPRPVVAAVVDYIAQAASRTSDEYPRWGYETLDEHRAEMAAYSGCKKDELAFTHNATEAMSIIADGIDLKAGDEVLITDQEHPSGRGPWLKKQARYGVKIREVKIPLPPRSPEQLTDIIVSAIGPRTKVLSFSGILTTTGLVMPVRPICDAARAKGVLTVVDGAHMSGQIDFRIDGLGCDFFAGSPHKWLFAPAGCGLLYIREEMLERLWPGTVTGNWDNKELKAARFMMMGTNNRAIFEGMMAGLRFHQTVGSQVIYSRIHGLARRIRERAEKLAGAQVLTPPNDGMYGSLVTFDLKDADTKPFFAECKRRRIWVMTSNRLRISAHIHTRPSDIDALFSVLEDTAVRKLARR